MIDAKKARKVAKLLRAAAEAISGSGGPRVGTALKNPTAVVNWRSNNRTMKVKPTSKVYEKNGTLRFDYKRTSVNTAGFAVWRDSRWYDGMIGQDDDGDYDFVA